MTASRPREEPRESSPRRVEAEINAARDERAHRRKRGERAFLVFLGLILIAGVMLYLMTRPPTDAVMVTDPDAKPSAAARTVELPPPRPSPPPPLPPAAASFGDPPPVAVPAPPPPPPPPAATAATKPPPPAPVATPAPQPKATAAPKPAIPPAPKPKPGGEDPY